MSNVLKVSHQEAIRGLHQKGWSKRRIARELGIHRQTVNRYSEGGSEMYRHFDPRLWRGIGFKVYHHFDLRLGECGWEGSRQSRSLVVLAARAGVSPLRRRLVQRWRPG